MRQRGERIKQVPARNGLRLRDAGQVKPPVGREQELDEGLDAIQHRRAQAPGKLRHRLEVRLELHPRLVGSSSGLRAEGSGH